MAYPILAASNTWYKSSVPRGTITQIDILDSYTPGAYDETWNADVDNTGAIKCYRIGTVIKMVGNGSGKVSMNPDSSFAFSDSSGAAYFSKIVTINNSNLLECASNIVNIGAMFANCNSLTTLDVSNWDTSNITNMSSVFYGCNSLTTLDVSNWDTGNVTNMYCLFYKCNALQSLDVSNWDTGNVTNIQHVFYYCNALQSPDVSNWNTSNVTNMSSMFCGCDGLTALDVSNWDTSNVADMSYMFYGCNSLTTLDVSNWDTNNVADMSYMFYECNSLRALDLSKWNTSNVTDMKFIFSVMKNLKKITLGENFSRDAFGTITSSTNKATLPTPSSDYIDGADGNWYGQDGNVYSDPTAIPNGAGTYYAIGDVFVKYGTLDQISEAVRSISKNDEKMTPNEMVNELINIANNGVNQGGNVSDSQGVNFYDYDGKLLYSYTLSKIQSLTTLPPAPSHNGLIFQGWNYDLDTIKSYNRTIDVGASYITDDGKTRLYIKIAAEGRMTVPLYFKQSVENGVTIDWGDGSNTETLSGVNYVNTSHTYTTIGDYVITLNVTNGTLDFGNDTTNYCIMGLASTNGLVYCNMLQKVEIGNNVTNIGRSAFINCASLASITIPNSVTSIGAYAFRECYSLISTTIPNGITSISDYTFSYCHSLANITIPHGITSIGRNAFTCCYSLVSIVIPNNVTNIDYNAFGSCYSLVNIIIPNGVTNIGSGAFSYCTSLASIIIPNDITNIGDYTFSDCYGIILYDFSNLTAVPTLSNKNAFDGIDPCCKIMVPKALENEWAAATNWSTYANQIVTSIQGGIQGGTGS